MPSGRKSVSEAMTPTIPKSEPSRRAKSSLPYKAGDMILCLHQGALYYEAKITDATTQKDGDVIYTIHFQGWNKRYDESVSSSEAADRFREHNPASVAEAKREAASTSSATKKKTITARAAETSTAPSSRATTPSDSKRRGNRDSSSEQSAPPPKRGRKSTRDTPTASHINHSLSAALSNSSISSTPTARPPTPVKTELKQGLEFPQILRSLLYDDQTLVRDGQLPRLPAKSTVEKIIDDYKGSLTDLNCTRPMFLQSQCGNAEPHQTITYLRLCADGVTDYFNSALRNYLLYKSEWAQYDELKDKFMRTKTQGDENRVFKPSAVYGIVHLVRLLTKYDKLMIKTNITQTTRNAIMANAHDLASFLAANKQEYFKDDDYVSSE